MAPSGRHAGAALCQLRLYAGRGYVRLQRHRRRHDDVPGTDALFARQDLRRQTDVDYRQGDQRGSGRAIRQGHNIRRGAHDRLAHKHRQGKRMVHNAPFGRLCRRHQHRRGKAHSLRRGQVGGFGADVRHDGRCREQLYPRVELFAAYDASGTVGIDSDRLYIRLRHRRKDGLHEVVFIIDLELI